MVILVLGDGTEASTGLRRGLCVGHTGPLGPAPWRAGA